MDANGDVEFFLENGVTLDVVSVSMCVDYKLDF